jgi:excisionase family DNA binding protein
MPDRILAEPPRRLFLATADVARVFGVSTGFVRRLARRGDLAYERLEGGQRVFRRDVVRRALIDRMEARARSRTVLLQVVRVRMLKAGFEPRQMDLLSRLRIVSRGERGVPLAEPKVARSFDRSCESDREHFVNRKVAHR